MIVKQGMAVRRQGGVFAETGPQMEILDAAKHPVPTLVVLFRLGLVARRDEPADGRLNPVVVGIGSALEHLVRGQRRRRGRGCIRIRRPEGGQAAAKTEQGDPAPPHPVFKSCSFDFHRGGAG